MKTAIALIIALALTGCAAKTYQYTPEKGWHWGVVKTNRKGWDNHFCPKCGNLAWVGSASPPYSCLRCGKSWK
jgi:5-methylcytosine-specific restriction endonuclease McrA